MVTEKGILWQDQKWGLDVKVKVIGNHECRCCEQFCAGGL